MHHGLRRRAGPVQVMTAGETARLSPLPRLRPPGWGALIDTAPLRGQASVAEWPTLACADIEAVEALAREGFD
jgi:hypothetical protein